MLAMQLPGSVIALQEGNWSCPQPLLCPASSAEHHVPSFTIEAPIYAIELE